MTKSINKQEVEDLFIERIYMLEYQWYPLQDKPPRRRKFLRGISKQKHKKNMYDVSNKRNVRRNIYPKSLNQTMNSNNMNDSFMSQSSINSQKLRIKLELNVQNVLKQNKFLLNLAKQMVQNFNKIVIIGQLLSPQITGRGDIPFDCLNTFLNNGTINSKDSDMEYVIEIERLLKILTHLEIDTTKEDLQELGLLTKTLKCYKYTDSENRQEKISAVQYFNILKILRDVLYPHRAQKKVLQTQDANAEYNDMEEQPELPPDDWNYGSFQIGIIRCTCCNYHQTTSWHQEIEFVEKFNELGILLKQVFPRIELVGNEFEPQRMEQFDVYIKGCNSKDPEDFSPAFLYKKTQRIEDFLKDFKIQMLKVYDSLCLKMANFLNYSNEMAEFQEMVFESKQNIMPQPYKGYHSHPHKLTQEDTKVIERKVKKSKYARD